jgi:hypothetical protein
MIYSITLYMDIEQKLHMIILLNRISSYYTHHHHIASFKVMATSYNVATRTA